MTGAGPPVPPRGFPYAARAAEVTAASDALRAAARALRDRRDASDPATIAWEAAAARVHHAIERAYPPGFREALDALRSGDPAGLETAIDVLEGDPLFFRSGYVKAELIRLISRQPLTETQMARLRDVVLGIVDRRDGREFRRYCRLARRLDDQGLRRDLDVRRRSDDADIRRRAAWVLDALGPGPTPPAGETRATTRR